MTQVDDLNLYFVLPDGRSKDNCPEDLKLAHDVVVQYGGNSKWVSSDFCLEYIPGKQDVFVFDEFKGSAFEHLKKNSGKILGARFTLTCVTHGRSIPPAPTPIFTEGMRDLFICSTGFKDDQKEYIKEKIEYMGGVFDGTLRTATTHIIAHSNINKKVIKAYTKNISVMKYEWVDEVWKRSQEKHVNGKDEEFNDFKSPLFHNLVFTTSGMGKREKDKITELIQSNGGVCMGVMELGKTDFVILSKPEGEKYKHAKQWKIFCVNPKWIYNCVDAKAVISFNEYIVKDKPKSSTPERDMSNITANFSMISNITHVQDVQVTHLEESRSVMMSQFQSQFQVPRLPDNKCTYSDIIDNHLLKNIKSAGQFLDGCKIFLSGFSADDSEKLKKVLNFGGAMRFNELTETVSHVIVGKKNANDLANFKGVYVLGIDWLVESVKLKRPAPEKTFLLVDNVPNSAEPPSPLSKQGAKLLSRNDSKMLQKPSFDLDKEDEEAGQKEEELLNKYNLSQPGEPLDRPEQPLSRSNSTASSKLTGSLLDETLFKNLIFYMSNELTEEDKKRLESLIVERQGQIVGKRFLGVPHYAVVPVVATSLTETTAKEVVTAIFIQDCMLERRIVDVQYYHQPIAIVKDATPLKNCVVTVSNYGQTERDFLSYLSEELGAVFQTSLARKPKGDTLKTTHLVTGEPTGQKYNGALRWGLPIVHHKWILDCAAKGVRLSEENYLVGDCKISASSVTNSTNAVTTPVAQKSFRPPNVTNSASTFITPVVQKSCMPPPNSSGRNSPGFSATKRLKLETPKPNENSEHPVINLDPEPPSKNSPIHNAVKRLKLAETPRSSESPDPNRTVTPTSPYGAFIHGENPPPATRKRLLKWMNQGADFPQDSPVNYQPENRRDSTPLSEILSRHLLMMKRKPEDLPPDSPASAKKPNPETEKTDSSENSDANLELLSSLQKMKEIEENVAKNTVRSTTPIRKAGDIPQDKMVVIAESQPHTEIGWEDPGEKEVALVKLERAAESELAPKYFLFSSSKEDNDNHKKIVEESGGKVLDSMHYDKRATHFIASSFTRSEKLMACIAAGVWILHPSYIDELKKVRSVHAICEEDFEWGNPQKSLRLNSLNDKMKECAVNSHYWRTHIQKGVEPPFKNIKIILDMKNEKYDQLKRVIEAGGGEIVDVKYTPVNSDNTVLIRGSTDNSKKSDLIQFAKKGVACVTLSYVYDLITRKPNALEKNFVPGFSELWRK